MISGAVFLYFDDPLVVTPPAQVITKNAFRLLEIMEKRQPTWARDFAFLFGNWRLQQNGFTEAMTELKPLVETGALKPFWMIYPATRNALSNGWSLAQLSGLSEEELLGCINPQTAGSELIRHILLEAYLEFHEDIEELYRYCGGETGGQTYTFHILHGVKRRDVGEAGSRP